VPPDQRRGYEQSRWTASIEYEYNKKQRLAAFKGWRQERIERHRAMEKGLPPPPRAPKSEVMGWPWAIKEKYRELSRPRFGPDGRPRTPEQEFKDAFMEEFNKSY
jgi:hypothetical protein